MSPKEIKSLLEGAAVHFHGSEAGSIVEITLDHETHGRPIRHLISLPNIAAEAAIRGALGLEPRKLKLAGSERHATSREGVERDAVVDAARATNGAHGAVTSLPNPGLTEALLDDESYSVVVYDIERREDGVGGWTTHPETGERLPLTWTPEGGWVLDHRLHEEQQQAEWGRASCNAMGRCVETP